MALETIIVFKNHPNSLIYSQMIYLVSMYKEFKFSLSPLHDYLHNSLTVNFLWRHVGELSLRKPNSDDYEFFGSWRSILGLIVWLFVSKLLYWFCKQFILKTHINEKHLNTYTFVLKGCVLIPSFVCVISVDNIFSRLKPRFEILVKQVHWNVNP